MERSHIKAAIIGGIIAAVIVIIFVDPLLTLLWNAVVWSSTNIYEGYIDAIYKNAALGTRNYVSVMILAIFMAVYFGLGTGMIVSLLSVRPRVSMSKWFADKRKRAAVKIVAVILVALIFLLPPLTTVVTVFADMQLNTSFNQRLAVVSPKITGLERREFVALWASMKNRKDYEDILQRMDKMAEAHGISLPKPLLK